MIASRALSQSFEDFNRAQGAPWGHRIWRYVPGKSYPLIKLAGAYSWQHNSSTRMFEYPWAFEQITAHGSRLVIVDVGASLAGMQFSLAAAGHTVHAVDPGMRANGRGWNVDAQFHQRLCRVLKAPVRLHPTTIDQAHIPDESVDVILSISTLEHLTAEDRLAFVQTARRLLRPSGVVILTVDLFLNLAPFTDRESNDYGINVNVAELLRDMGAELVIGDPSQIYGFPEFDSQAIQSSLEKLLISASYPALAQCLVARLSEIE